MKQEHSISLFDGNFKLSRILSRCHIIKGNDDLLNQIIMELKTS
jgi:hypothetical protein